MSANKVYAEKVVGAGELEHLTIVETILRNRRKFFTEIRQQIDVPQKIRAMLVSCFVFLAIYGAVMGASHSVQQAIASFVKLPILFLATLAICTPSLHFFNILFGSKQTMLQTIALILTAISTTSRSSANRTPRSASSTIGVETSTPTCCSA